MGAITNKSTDKTTQNSPANCQDLNLWIFLCEFSDSTVGIGKRVWKSTITSITEYKIVDCQIKYEEIND